MCVVVNITNFNSMYNDIENHTQTDIMYFMIFTFSLNSFIKCKLNTDEHDHHLVIINFFLLLFLSNLMTGNKTKKKKKNDCHK